jgi:hypothetical protein
MRPEKFLKHVAPRAVRGDEDQLDADRERLCELVDPQAISDVLREFRVLTPLASVRASDARSYAARVLGVDADSIGIGLEIDPCAPSGAAQLQCELHGVLFIMHGRLRNADERIELCGPLRLYKSDRRDAFRQPLEEGRAELHWSALDSEHSSAGHSYVRDLSPSGASIVPAPGSAPPPSGVFPAELRIADLRVPCLAEMRRAPSEPGGAYGLHLIAGRGGDDLIDVYLRERLPRLVPRHEVDTKALRELMVKSGYLSLRAAKTSFPAWQRFQTPNAFACDRVYRAADGRLLGHASATRIYRHTWILHQLATINGHPESAACRAMLYSMVTSVPELYDGKGASAMAYFDLDLRWHDVFFKNFIRWIGSSKLACIFAFDRFERDDPPEAFDPPEGYSVRVALETEMIPCAALVRAHLPPITANAFDTHPGELRRIAARRTDRGREVLVLMHGDELAGVALCETGAPNLSLFNIVNMVQLYVRRGPRAPSVPAQRALIVAARAFYAARRIDSPLVIAPAGTVDHDAEPGTRWAESMGCMVITGRGLTQWENYCRFQFGRRWGRKPKSKGHTT